MTESNFGRVFNYNEVIDFDSIVSLASCPSATTILSGTFNVTTPSTSHNYDDVVFIIDNEGDRRLALITTGPVLKVYKVDTNAQTISEESSTAFSQTDSVDFYFGVKEESSGLYYIYYGSKTGVDAGCTSYKFRRVSVPVGGSSSDTLLATETFSEASCWWELQCHKIKGKVGYVGLVKNKASFTSTVGLAVHVYSINMETEAISGGEEWAVNPGAECIYGLTYRCGLNFAETGGSIVWIFAYMYNQIGSPHSCYCYIVISGSSTLVHTFSYVSGGEEITPDVDFPTQYNARDYVCCVYFQYQTGSTYRYTVIAGVIAEVASFPLGLVEQMFISSSYYPAMCVVSGTMFYWADPTTGQPSSVVDISGVNTILMIFRTLDVSDGSIYMYALMDDSSYKFIGVDPFTHEITRMIDIGVIPSDYYYNHGNFLVGLGVNDLTMLYIMNFVTSNILYMIPEQN